jgi:hypothetical protein
VSECSRVASVGSERKLKQYSPLRLDFPVFLDMTVFRSGICSEAIVEAPLTFFDQRSF